MTTQPVLPTPRRLSKSSLASLICGILGCIPFVTGGLAVLLGIVGIVRTRNPDEKGRWMAIVGLLLGIASLGMWTLGGGTAAVAYWYARTAALDINGASVATHDFIKGISEDNSTLIDKHDGGFSKETLKDFSDYFKAQGKFIDTSFNTSVTNDVTEVTGTAQFELNTQTVKANLAYKDGDWKVTQLEVRPLAKP